MTTTAHVCWCSRWFDGNVLRDTAGQNTHEQKKKEEKTSEINLKYVSTQNVLATHPLIVLFLGDLFDLIEQLLYAQLNFGQFFLLCNVGIVDGMFADLNIQMDTQL